MAVIEKVVDVPPERVFAVLADGWTYSDWVVGISHIARVGADWPSAGSAVHYQVGAGQLGLRATITAVAADPPFNLVISPKVWPLGEYLVRIVLDALEGGRTKITFSEELVAGPLHMLRRKTTDGLLYLRGRETVHRLAELAVHRPAPAGPAPSPGDTSPALGDTSPALGDVSQKV
jgi:uncharacterized protein YndB with AHSA1/START domain